MIIRYYTGTQSTKEEKLTPKDLVGKDNQILIFNIAIKHALGKGDIDDFLDVREYGKIKAIIDFLIADKNGAVLSEKKDYLVLANTGMLRLYLAENSKGIPVDSHITFKLIIGS